MRKVLFAHPMSRMCLLVMLSLVLLSTAAYCQDKGSIVGTVSDPTGAAIPDAKVTITNADTGIMHSLTSNAAGAYAGHELPVGRYNVKVEMAGFKTYDQSGIVLNVNDSIRVDATLQVGESKDSITVEANAVQVQAQTNEVSQTITDSQVADLATNGRNVIQLAALVPGAASSLPGFDTVMAQTQSRAIQYNGQRNDHNAWLINGGEAYDRGGGGIMLVSPSQDAIAEFKVMTSNYAADLGQASGGMIIMSTKSGTQQWHGGAWEYVRNDDLNANTWSGNAHPQANGKAQAIPELRYNTFGFNLGGPVPIEKPRKTFFFYNMEWRRRVNAGQITNTNVTTAAEKTGDFSALLPANGCTSGCVQLLVPAVADPAYIAKLAQYGLSPSTTSQKNYFPNNKIPAGLIDPNATAVFAAGLFPSGNTPSGAYIANTNQLSNYREEAARLDHQFNSKLAVMASLLYDNGIEDDYPPLWAGGSFATAGSMMAVPSWAGVVHATHTISPTLLNETSFNLNGNNINITDLGLWKKPSGYTVQNIFASNTAGKLPAFSIGSPYGESYTPGWWPWYNTWRSWQGKDDLSWVHGKHDMKFGFSYMFTHKWQQYQLNAGGQFNFGTQTGNSLGDMLLGLASSYSEPVNVGFVQISNNTFTAYAMDDWRATSRLTLNLGLRWEGLPHAYDTANNASNFYPSLYNPAQAAHFLPSGALDTTGPGFTTVPGAPVSTFPFYMNGVGLAGKNGVPSGLVNNSWDTFAPRIGFAYDLTGKQKTILRAGAGMFYERLAGNEMYNLIQASVPFAFNSTLTNVYLSNPTTTWTNGTTATIPYGPAAPWMLDKAYKVPTSLQWSLGIQQQLAQDAVLSVSYVGNSNFHQTEGVNINALPQSDTTDRLAVCGSVCGYSGVTANANLYRPYQGWAQIYDQELGANSDYNSLQVSIRTTDWHHLTFAEAYTWSHAFDIIDGEIFSAVSNPYDTRWDRSQAGFDRRQISVTSIIYKFPFLRNSPNQFLRTAVGGWEISAIYTLESGTPFSVGYGSDNLGLGGGTGNRAEVVGPLTYPKTMAHWFSQATFVAPAALQWSDQQRNDVVGPQTNMWNMALYKAFQVKENARVEFRAETFNTFNHPNWANPGANVTGGVYGASNAGACTTSTNCGVITNTSNAPRVFQLGLKFLF